MDIPRLILAEEATGSLPVGVMLAGALKQRGYKLRLFSSYRDERVLRLVELVCSQRCHHLDAEALGTVSRLKALFEAASAEGELSLVLSPLGHRGKNDRFFPADSTLKLMEALECPVLPILRADTSAFAAAGVLAQVMGAIPPNWAPMGLFLGVPNPREYQLLDREVGRRLPFLSLGYLPRDFIRDMPSVEELCSSKSPALLAGLKAAVARLQSMEHQVLWPAFGALGTMAEPWRPQDMPELLPSKPMVGILKHHSMSLGGGNGEALLAAMGCSVVPVPVEDGDLPQGLDGLLIPHGPAYLGLLELRNNRSLVASIGRMFLSGKPVLADGGSAVILGREVLAPSGSVRGLAMFPYDGIAPGSDGELEPRVIRAVEDGPLLKKGETSLGLKSPWSGFLRSRETQGEWQVEYVKGGLEGMDGWSLRKGVACSVRLELWSCYSRVRRWLGGL
ncbi:cobyrinic acid a,c-diamide synthase [Thermanaerovibrio velox DSM 12556]|uniref:Cobyrinic acid a,c-diamide synthase n=1 Tax=Thermanaerovibrio velox DSM 12556 TaxID=926567 RepID=H0UNC7_9BACT|nr:hypothetical protein [Thermanaerovibrio velox]EHM09334.1 cobyrinic acid a,c-diamide synthase [Thermanaerovibrio velox DSM 12556]